MASIDAGKQHVETRYCTHCKILWLVSIGRSGIRYELVPRGHVVEYCDEDEFGLAVSVGNESSRKYRERVA